MVSLFQTFLSFTSLSALFMNPQPPRCFFSPKITESNTGGGPTFLWSSVFLVRFVNRPVRWDPSAGSKVEAHRFCRRFRPSDLQVARETRALSREGHNPCIFSAIRRDRPILCWQRVLDTHFPTDYFLRGFSKTKGKMIKPKKVKFTMKRSEGQN